MPNHIKPRKFKFVARDRRSKQYLSLNELRLLKLHRPKWSFTRTNFLRRLERYTRVSQDEPFYIFKRGRVLRVRRPRWADPGTHSWINERVGRRIFREARYLRVIKTRKSIRSRVRFFLQVLKKRKWHQPKPFAFRWLDCRKWRSNCVVMRRYPLYYTPHNRVSPVSRRRKFILESLFSKNRDYFYFGITSRLGRLKRILLSEKNAPSQLLAFELRLDVFLCKIGVFKDQRDAFPVILSGGVLVNNLTVRTPSRSLKSGDLVSFSEGFLYEGYWRISQSIMTLGSFYMRPFFIQSCYYTLSFLVNTKKDLRVFKGSKRMSHKSLSFLKTRHYLERL